MRVPSCVSAVRVLLLVMLGSLLMPLQGSAQELDPNIPTGVSLAEIQSTVQNTFDSVQSLKLDADLMVAAPRSIIMSMGFRDGVPVVTSSREATNLDTIMVNSHTWAFQNDGKEYLGSLPAYELGGTPPSEKRVFGATNGESVRTLIQRDDSDRPPNGTIKPPGEAEERFANSSAVLVGAGRAWGRSINNVSLPEWLSREEAHVTGRSQLGGFDCIVVEVPYTVPSDPNGTAIVRFHLVEDKNFALAAWESHKNGQIRSRGTNTKLEEILPGVWFPIAGTIDSFDKSSKGHPSRSSVFDVRNIEVNVDLPQSLFDLEFPIGTRVSDKRLGDFRYVAGEPQLASLADHIDIDGVNDTGRPPQSSQNVNSPTPAVRTLAVGVDTTPIADSNKRNFLFIIAIVATGAILTLLVKKFSNRIA